MRIENNYALCHETPVYIGMPSNSVNEKGGKEVKMKTNG